MGDTAEVLCAGKGWWLPVASLRGGDPLKLSIVETQA
jgi:hypothetical protein